MTGEMKIIIGFLLFGGMVGIASELSGIARAIRDIPTCAHTIIVTNSITIIPVEVRTERVFEPTWQQPWNGTPNIIVTNRAVNATGIVIECITEESK
jgi:hypothetical protein